MSDPLDPPDHARQAGSPLPHDNVGLLEGITTTRAIRRFRDEPISESDLASMFYAATRAPSMANTQPFRFIVLRDDDRAVAAKQVIGDGVRTAWLEMLERTTANEHEANRKNLAKVHGQGVVNPLVEDFAGVPVVVLACLDAPADDAGAGGGIYPACQNLLLAARAMGYGGVLTGFHRQSEGELRMLLNIPESVFIAATIALGKPVGNHGAVRRHPLSHFVFEHEWKSSASWAIDPPGARFVDAPR